MRCHYSLMPADIIHYEHTLLPLLKAAGVDQVWITGTLSGRPTADAELTRQAKLILDRCGFDSRGFASVVVGHPGNALNPEDPTLDLTIPASWRYRVDRHGKPVYFCADIEPHMIADNAAAARQMRELGFTQFFVDDDFRMGNWGQEIQGCFCDHCITEFNHHLGYTTSRVELSRAVEKLNEPALLEEWVAYNCHKVERCAAVLAEECEQFGIMVMHHGDERHGLDLAAWRASDANLLIRVGEMYFSDEGFNQLRCKISEMVSILLHLTLVGRRHSHSETTIFPPRALSPENWVHKMKLTLAAGTEDIFFMGGTWIIEDNYWQAVVSAMPGLRELAGLAAPDRRFPIHVVAGTHGSRGEPLDPPYLPFASGLPALPVRGAHIPSGGQVLLAFGDYDIGEEWDAAMDRYAVVICDEPMLARNPDLASRKPVRLPLNASDDTPGSLEALRKAIAATAPGYPWLAEGRDIALFWLPDGVLLLNLQDCVAEGILAFGSARRTFKLAPRAAAYTPLTAENIGGIRHII